jgi:hypothetical protein
MVYQISVFLENRAGQFAEITGILAENGIDLRAISIAETADYGILRMIVDDAQKATSLLMQHGYLLTMTPVIVVAVSDQPGGIAPVLATMAEGNIDIEYMYSLFTHIEGKAYIVFRVAEAEKFISLLSSHGIMPSTNEELGIH